MSRFRRPLFAVLALLLVVSLIAGCAGQKAEVTPPAPQKLKVGLVFDIGGRGDLSFNDSAYAGLVKASQEFGTQIDSTYLEPTAGGENREELLRLLAQDGYGLILGIGFMFTDHVIKVSQEFPDIKFGLVDGYIEGLTESSNVVCLLFPEQEGSFLVGVAAGLKTTTNKVGFVGGMKVPLIERFEAGYSAGVKYVNPKATVLVDYIGTTGEAFKDPVKGEELALAQYGKGCDVVYHASGASGIGVIKAATAKKKLCIGVDSDQSLTAKDEEKPYILTSMLKRVDVAVYETIKAYVGSAFKGGYQVLDVAKGGLGYAQNQYNQALLADIVAKIEEAKAKVISGEIKVPGDNAQLAEFLKALPQ